MTLILMTAVIILLIFFAVCFNASKANIKPLILQLEKLGYYQFTEPSQVEKIKKDSIKYGYVYGYEESGRDFQSDAEDLAEGGAKDLFDNIKIFLDKQNVIIQSFSEHFSDQGYKISVNGVEHVIYNETEIQSEELWDISSVRILKIVNNLLKDANSKEKAYILYGGNDLRVIFLTEAMYQAIIKFKKLSDEEKPQKVE